MRGADTAVRLLTGLTVAGLAGVAGAVSFSHMTALAREHDQSGWHAIAFPISVDGLELVASLFLVAQRRAGRRTGPLPWLALLFGLGASLAANIAVGSDDLLGRAIAGWPALALLMSVKLLFSLFDPATAATAVPTSVRAADGQSAAGDDQRTAADGRRTDRDDATGVRSDARTVPTPSGTTTDPWADRLPVVRSAVPVPVPAPTANAALSVPVDIHAVSDLLPAAQAARDALTDDGRALSREALADRMRANGHPVSNARASALLKVLRAEDSGSPITRTDRTPESGAA